MNSEINFYNFKVTSIPVDSFVQNDLKPQVTQCADGPLSCFTRCGGGHLSCLV